MRLFHRMRLTVNGRSHELFPDSSSTLLELLRDHLALNGSKLACDRGECGACSVLIDGELSYACVTLAAACDGASVTTVEGLASPGESQTLAPLQLAFIAHDAAQCGFCTPGQLVAAHALLERNRLPSDDDIREAMSGNLCRCGTYPRVARAIRAVADGAFARSDSSAT